MESVTKTLGNQLRSFSSVTCASFKTPELPKEAAARARRQSKREAKDGGDPTAATTRGEQKSKSFNLFTYKIHALATMLPPYEHLEPQTHIQLKL